MNILSDILFRLQQQARERPDLLSANQGGPSWGSPDYRPPGEQRVATFAGRVVNPGETLQQVLQRFPQGETEAGGQAMQFLLPQLAVVVPARTAKERLAQKLMRESHPKLWQRAEADPRTLTTKVGKLEGKLGVYDPAKDVVTIDPRSLAGNYSPSATHITPERVVGHELAHFVNQPEVFATSTARAVETAEQLTKLMEGTDSHAFLQNYLASIDKLAPVIEKMKSEAATPFERDVILGLTPRRALTEAFSELLEQSMVTQPDQPLFQRLAEAFGMR